MNLDVLLLFFNAFLAVVTGAVIVYRILRKEYWPVIRDRRGDEADNDGAI